MISAGDFRNGLTVLIEGNIYQILEFQHVKPGKGAAFVRTKLKNIISGGVVEKTFRPTEKFDTAHIDRKDMQYLYSDGELYHFMDVETFDQIAVDGDTVTVTGGAWEGTVGMIQTINMAKQSLTINVDLFGRETPVEISFAEVKKM